MSQTYVGGIMWTVGTPGTEQRIMLRWAGKEWPVVATKAESAKGVFWLYDYQFRMWNPRCRPFDRDWQLGLDNRGHVVVRAPALDCVLWSLATGRDWKELPQGISASGGFDDQPRQQRERPRQAQSQQGVGSSMTHEAPRQSMGQRIAKALRLVKEHDASTSGGRHDDE
jgi:hypothetical protein